MLLSRSIRRQHALSAVNHLSKPFPPLYVSPRRHQSDHKKPRLPHEGTWAVSGIPNLLSRDAFDLAWTQYQGYIISKLNQLTSDIPNRFTDTKALLLEYARDAEKASLFNHASMAHNNHLFFVGIANKPISIPESLLNEINTSFSSIDSLRATFIATADAMFGPGFVWLIKKNNPIGSSGGPKLSILTTYLAGSPYPGAHFRRQQVDMATTDNGIRAGDSPSHYAARQYGLQNAGSFGNYSKGVRFVAPGGQDLEVLMCVSTWQHTWLRDYGFDGKRRYLESWWRMIDWENVHRLMGDEKIK